jgi:hypothetical protein
MSRWCRIEGHAIAWGPGALPRVWQDISNFHALPEADLRARGWLPHRFVETATPGQVITGSTTEITDIEVIETQAARDPTTEELADQARATVPEEVALWQFRAALKLGGNFERVQYALAQLNAPEVIVAAELFEYGNKIYRRSTLADAIIRILDVSESDVDALFRQAAEIKA